MKRILRKILRITAICLLILLVVVIVGVNVLMHMYSEDSAVQRLKATGYEMEQRFVSFKEFEINAYRIGNPDHPKVLFIHGSPGHWTDWANVLTDTAMLEKYCMIAYDRPGYGNTTVPATAPLEAQADVAATVIDAFCGEEECFTAVGHSYGGGVVEELLLSYPDRVNKGVYIAGTLSPQHQPRKWYNYLASFRLFQWAIPGDMRASNLEMMQLQEELMLNRGKHDRISDPIVLLQGTADVLVPFETVDYYEEVMPSGVEYIIVDGLNHFIPWTDPDLIREAIEK